jgi:hypothetical protein
LGENLQASLPDAKGPMGDVADGDSVQAEATICWDPGSVARRLFMLRRVDGRLEIPGEGCSWVAHPGYYSVVTSSPEQIGPTRISCAGNIGRGRWMPQYRFYNLEQNGQAIIARIDLALDDDAAAIACAEQLVVGEAIEVWEGSRLVASLCSLANDPYVVSSA